MDIFVGSSFVVIHSYENPSYTESQQSRPCQNSSSEAHPFFSKASLSAWQEKVIDD